MEFVSMLALHMLDTILATIMRQESDSVLAGRLLDTILATVLRLESDS